MSASIEQVMQTARQHGASDIHLKVGLPPIFRIAGELRSVQNLSATENGELIAFAERVLSPRHKAAFELNHDVDVSYADPAGGRYRINIYHQRGLYGVAMRVIPLEVPAFERLNLPDVLLRLANERRGLVLVTGATGSGKSTTLASMVDYINRSRAAHIITIEDPIEYMHRDQKSIVNQRELDFDTTTFARGLRAALRQDPDVIQVGEMRDLETMETALVAAETGHLVLSTIHTVDAVETVNRIVSAFPAHQQQQIRLQLASIIKGVISQRLVTRADGRGLVPAVEVMIGSQRVRQLIENSERTRELHEAISTGRNPYGMISFDQSLAELVQKRLITAEEAVLNSSRPDDLRLFLKGFGATAQGALNTGASPQESKSTNEKLEISRFGSK